MQRRRAFIITYTRAKNIRSANIAKNLPRQHIHIFKAVLLNIWLGCYEQHNLCMCVILIVILRVLVDT